MLHSDRQKFPGLWAIRLGALLAAGVALGGCAGLADSAMSEAFVDPARYELFDCKRLEAERAALAARTRDINGLIEKAKTGAAGAVVAEVAYRNDYLSVRAQARLADKAWASNRCDSVGTAPAPGGAPARPGSGIY